MCIFKVVVSPEHLGRGDYVCSDHLSALSTCCSAATLQGTGGVVKRGHLNVLFWLCCRQLPLYNNNNDIRWQQPNPNPAGPYLAYPIISAQPPVSTEYTYYQLMPAPCAQVMGFYHPFPTPYSAPFQTASAINTVATECAERPVQPSPVFPVCPQRSRSANRGPAIQKVRPLRPLE